VKERLRKSLRKTEKEIQEENKKPSLNRSEPTAEECDELLKCPSSDSPLQRRVQTPAPAGEQNQES